MADINQIISFGIGTPAGIQEYLTLGLQIGAGVPDAYIDLMGRLSGDIELMSALSKDIDLMSRLD